MLINEKVVSQHTNLELLAPSRHIFCNEPPAFDVVDGSQNSPCSSHTNAMKTAMFNCPKCVSLLVFIFWKSRDPGFMTRAVRLATARVYERVKV